MMPRGEGEDGLLDIEQAWYDGLLPDPLLSVSEWADQHRMLSSKASAEPGRWRTSRTPYLKAIMNCLSPMSSIERVVFIKGSQLGATECINNAIAYVIHQAPGPMMFVSPTVEMAKRNSKQRIDSLIEESPALAELISPARSRDSGNTILTKEFRGGVLVMTGANSAVGLRSMPVRYLFLDEVDAYPHDVDGEGDAIALAEARTRTFARRKIFIVSTPTIAGASAIEREYAASDQGRYFVPCPHCQHRQHLRFEQLRWQKGDPTSAAYYCEACEQAINEQHKTWMLEHGQWQAMAPEQATAGFHLSSLYSPVGWRSWCDIAASWEAALEKETGSAAVIKTFKNTDLGETWVEEGEAPDWQRLLERREDYPMGIVPLGGLLLVGGADIQKDRIEASIWAFGRGKESWLIEHRVMMGDTARDTVWKNLASLIAETWSHSCGAKMPLVRFAIDTGYATQEAYAFVRACHDPRIMAVKGVPRGAALIGIPTAVDVNQGGKRLRRGIKLYAVTVSIAKLELYNNLRKSVDVADDGSLSYPAGYVHLPKIDAEYIQQLCAEQLVTHPNRNGFQVREWQKMRERNEGLDCFDEETEALTYVGWKRFADIGFGDLMATVNLETDCIEYQSPQYLINRPYQGPMMVVEGKRLNFAVTPNHRMLTFHKVFDRKIGKWNFDVPVQVTQAKDLKVNHTIKIKTHWLGNGIQTVRIPASIKRRDKMVIEPAREVDAVAFAAFLGWYVAEGCLTITAHKSSIRKIVYIAQTKLQGREQIAHVLDALPWCWHWDRYAAAISSKQLYDYLFQVCPGYQEERRVPQWVKNSDPRIITAFVDAAIAGDGWIQDGIHRSYATTSKLLADDMAELFLKLGGSPSVTEKESGPWAINGRSGPTSRTQYWVRENNKRRSAALDGTDRKCMVKEKLYDGRIYCATVSNGTLIVRRHGKMLIAGNCAVYSRASAAAAGLDRFEERHWRELERQLGVSSDPASQTALNKATKHGGLAVSGEQKTPRRVVKSRWMSS